MHAQASTTDADILFLQKSTRLWAGLTKQKPLVIKVINLIKSQKKTIKNEENGIIFLWCHLNYMSCI